MKNWNHSLWLRREKQERRGCEKKDGRKAGKHVLLKCKCMTGNPPFYLRHNSVPISWDSCTQASRTNGRCKSHQDAYSQGIAYVPVWTLGHFWSISTRSNTIRNSRIKHHSHHLEFVTRFFLASHWALMNIFSSVQLLPKLLAWTQLPCA